MRKDTIFSAILLITITVALAATVTAVKAETTYDVYIMDPPTSGVQGVSSNGYWVGEIPVRISSGTTPPFQTVSYCMDPESLIYIGTTYQTVLAPPTDNSAWRAISYMLTWNYPQTSFDAAATQVAVWQLLHPGFTQESWLQDNIYNAGLAAAASAEGKDVARQTDHFNWIAPITANMTGIKGDPGETVTFIAQLTDEFGAPRPNVKVLLTADLKFSGSTQQLNASHISPAEAFTDSQGLVQVTITVPSDVLNGAYVEVKASTQSMWPQKYLDVTNPDAQDLIGIGENLGLTLSTNICLVGHIMAVPEAPLGVLSALGAFGGAYALWKFKKPRRKHTLPC